MLKTTEYEEAMTNTLQFWLDCHTKPDVWAENMTIDDIDYTFESCQGELKNPYFHFDWMKSALRLWCKDNRHLFKVCSCGISELGYEDCEHIGRTPTINELTEWFNDIYYKDYASIAKLVGERILRESLEKDGFKAYRNALKNVTHSVEVEVKDALKQIRKAKNELDKLAALAWANHVNHINGNIVQDYGDRFDLDYNTIEAIAENGMEVLDG